MGRNWRMWSPSPKEPSMRKVVRRSSCLWSRQANCEKSNPPERSFVRSLSLACRKDPLATAAVDVDCTSRFRMSRRRDRNKKIDSTVSIQ